MHHIVTYGGWYQRTTLHLSEIYEFFFSGKSSIDGLNPEQLSRLYQQLDLASVSRETSYLEYVQAKTKQGISVRYYEDGLYILQITASEVSDASDILQDYFEKQFGPAIIKKENYFVVAVEQDKRATSLFDFKPPKNKKLHSLY